MSTVDEERMKIVTGMVGLVIVLLGVGMLVGYFTDKNYHVLGFDHSPGIPTIKSCNENSVIQSTTENVDLRDAYDVFVSDHSAYAMDWTQNAATPADPADPDPDAQDDGSAAKKQQNMGTATYYTVKGATTSQTHANNKCAFAVEKAVKKSGASVPSSTYTAVRFTTSKIVYIYLFFGFVIVGGIIVFATISSSTKASS